MTKLLIVRHAQSVWNAEHRWQGWADPPLSAQGEEQAAAGARRLAEMASTRHPPALVASSDLRRARRTAELLAAGAWGRPDGSRPVRNVVDPDLREYDAGEWTGLRRDEIEARWPAELAAWVAGDLDRVPGGEDAAGFEARLLAAVGRLGGADADGWVLAVSHGRAVHTLAAALGGGGGHVDHLSGWWLRTGPPARLVGPITLLDGAPPAAPVQDL